MNKTRYLFLSALVGAVGCMAPVSADGPRPSSAADRAQKRLRAEATAVPLLVRLVDENRLQTLNPDDFKNTALKDILKLTTPQGYRMKYRFLEIGVPVAQGLSLSDDRQLQNRLLESARFDSGRRARSEALLVLAGKKDPAHIKIFKEALLDHDVAIQFAAVEALRVWAQPEALPLLLNASARNWSPLIRVYSAEAVARLGSSEGLAQLRAMLTDSDWLIRAMAVRALGDLGQADDADRILSRLGAEHDNPFVVAELCLAGLKLWTKKGPAIPDPASIPIPGGRPRPVQVHSMFDMEPLVLTAPRLRVSGAHLIPPQIDTELVGLLEKIASEPSPEVTVLDPALSEVKNLVTPAGFGLYVRYTDISFLLTEGLAGTTNLTLINRLETISRSSPNTPVRGSAFVALGNDATRLDWSPFDFALRDPSVQVRFGATEGLSANANPLVRGMLAGVAQSDLSPAIRLFAAQALGERGDLQGVDIVRRYISDPDWVVRALATYYLGRLGDDSDFERLMVSLERETEDHVIAETCLAVLRMSR